MLLRQMLWVPRRVPVCVFERSRRGSLRSNVHLIFLGRLLVSPLLFMGATGYFAYLANHQRFRSKVYSELKHIMSAACLDNTYHILDWFMSKGRLFVYVAERTPAIRRGLGLSSKKAKSWLRKAFEGLR